MAELGFNGPILVGGGIIDSVFSYANPVLTVGTAVSPVTTLKFLSATAIIQMGTAPNTTAAINQDVSTYGGFALDVVNGTGRFQIFQGANSGAQLGSVTSTLTLFAANQAKWLIGSTTLESLLISQQVTARIRMGSTNGIALQNSAGTVDRYTFNDAGTAMVMTGSSGQGVFGTTGATGSVVAGGYVGGTVTSNFNVLTSANAPSGGSIFTLVISYRDITASVYRAALSISDAAGISALSIMPAGGTTTTGGSVVVGGSLNVANAGGIFWSTRTFLASSGNGLLELTNNAASAGVGFDLNTDAILKVRVRAQNAYATVDALAYQASGTPGVSGTSTPGTGTVTFVNGIVTAFT